MDAFHTIIGRRSVPRLTTPAPPEAVVQQLLQAAVSAPDHGQLQPWRFVLFSGEGRERLGEVFARAHLDRDHDADAGALDQTRCKPLRAPMIIAVICSPVSTTDAWNNKDIPAWEQLAATAVAAQNICLAATATGYGSMWRTGWYGDAPRVREALGLTAVERIVGWIYLGTIPEGHTPMPRRPRNLPDRVQRWT